MSSKILENDYDVIVIGAGHAGCEAAAAAARTGSKTLLLTINLDSISVMPCNSAIGGPGRGQLVREIDALGGLIAKNTDLNYIHSRKVNTSKGPALRTVRAVVDKRKYFLSMKNIIEKHENLYTRQGLVTGIDKKNNIYNIYTSDFICFKCKSAVIATGTFLEGKIFWGNYYINAGRHGEINSSKLLKNLKQMGYSFGRLRTETPPRVDKKSINIQKLIKQQYDDPPEMFSYENKYDGRNQIVNYLTYLEKDCIDYILKNIGKSSINLKKMDSENPKYCPSIEDKVKRFSEIKRHQVFVQPEGINTNEMYLHGLFTTFDEKIQQGIIRKISGLENASITRPGYGVEYSYLLPMQINNKLESKTHKNLFFAGQINGSTGYEEAAAQGIIAGLNASLSLKKKEILIKRHNGYIGVLIDDITNKGVTEPYRMLTSRNEFRIFHRHDNADLRMINILKIIGNNEKVKAISSKYNKINSAFETIKKSNYYKNKDLLEDIRQDRLSIDKKDEIEKEFNLDKKEMESLINDIKYEIYLKREREKIIKLKTEGPALIPQDINYKKIKDLSNEAIISLLKNRPASIEQASILEGVRPTDILVLIAFIKNNKNVSRET